MLEFNPNTIFISNTTRPILFQVLQIIYKWKVLFPELKDNIHKILLSMNFLNKNKGYLYIEVINGKRIISAPDIQSKFINVCDSFVRKGVLIRPINKSLQNDINKIINLVKKLDE